MVKVKVVLVLITYIRLLVNVLEHGVTSAEEEL